MDRSGTKDDQWRESLSPEAYHVLREQGTEPAFSGKYWNEKRTGMYRCGACGAELFSSEKKFDSGTGWPSFTDPAVSNAVSAVPDKNFGMERTEVRCSQCGSHLGHVFDDGPATMPDGTPASGKRFCINSLSLDFKEKDKQ